jgi:hypothetical protein
VTADDLCHSIVTYAYYKAMLEMTCLIDKEILVNNYDKLQKMAGEIKKLRQAFLFAIAICCFNGLTIGLSLLTSSRAFQLVNVYSRLIWQAVLLVLWGYSLLLVNRRLDQYGSLKPDKLMFRLHYWIIGLNLVLTAAIIVLFLCGTLTSENTALTLKGVEAICIVINDLDIVLGFWLALYVLLPVSAAQKKRQADMHAFLLNGFANHGELVREILT